MENKQVSDRQILDQVADEAVMTRTKTTDSSNGFSGDLTLDELEIACDLSIRHSLFNLVAGVMLIIAMVFIGIALEFTDASNQLIETIKQGER